MLQICKIYRQPSIISPLFLSPHPPFYHPIKLISCRPLHHRYTITIKAFATATATSEALNNGGDDTFFANDAISWASLRVSEKLSRSLNNAGFSKPSLIQVSLLFSVLCFE